MTPTPPNLITNGSYVLQIRKAPQYATYVQVTATIPSGPRAVVRRHRPDDQAFTLVAPSGHFIHTGDTFTLSDGGNTRPSSSFLRACSLYLRGWRATFPIYYTGKETAAGIAAADQHGDQRPDQRSDFTIYSAWNGTNNLTTAGPSNHVDLFNCPKRHGQCQPGSRYAQLVGYAKHGIG